MSVHWPGNKVRPLHTLVSNGFFKFFSKNSITLLFICALIGFRTFFALRDPARSSNVHLILSFTGNYPKGQAVNQPLVPTA